MPPTRKWTNCLASKTAVVIAKRLRVKSRKLRSPRTKYSQAIELEMFQLLKFLLYTGDAGNSVVRQFLMHCVPNCTQRDLGRGQFWMRSSEDDQHQPRLFGIRDRLRTRDRL